MKNVIRSFAVVFVVVGSYPAVADDANKQKLAESIAAINTDNNLLKTYASDIKSDLIKNGNYCIDKVGEEKLKGLADEKKNLTENLKKQEIEFYASNFTEEELTEINKFYSSDLGKKYLNKYVELASKFKTQKDYMNYVGDKNKIMADYYNQDGTCKSAKQSVEAK